MSKRVRGAVLLAAALIIIAVLTVWYFNRNTSTPPEEQRGTELVENIPEEIISDRVSAVTEKNEPEGPAQEADTDAYEFLLVDNNGYVAVCSLPENEIYEYTDVILDVLPEELQEEIREGKYLRNEEELYNFLENYTS